MSKPKAKRKAEEISSGESSPPPVPDAPDESDPRASTPPANDEDDQGRFGVFDHTRLRFVGGVYGSRKDAHKAAKAMGVPTAEIRPL